MEVLGTGGVLPGRDPPGRAEIVHESERTRVTRLFFPGGTVIRKEPLGPGAERRLRHERAILERVVLRGQDLRGPVVPLPVHQDAVGERATDVHADVVHGSPLSGKGIGAQPHRRLGETASRDPCDFAPRLAFAGSGRRRA
jgi:hypothetical protein